MSRHRNVRNLDLDDELDDDYDDYDEDYEDEYYEEESLEKQPVQVAYNADAVDQVRDVVGTSISRDIILEGLKACSGNIEACIDWVLTKQTASRPVAPPPGFNAKPLAPPPGFAQTVADVKPFAFETLSPDDIVKEAREGKGKPKVMAPTKSAPAPKKGVVPPKAGEPTMSMDQLQSDLNGLNLTANRPASPPDEDQEAIGGITSVPVAIIKQQKKFKKIDIASEWKKREEGKEGLGLVVIGHVDAGKSTLMGHLLFLLGEVEERTIQKHKRDAEKLKKSSFAYAWVLDNTAEERERGVTIDVAIHQFKTPNKTFTLLDAPGHRDFIPNMMSGASQADVAVLVVDATPGEFEAGFGEGGQTREHAVLVRTFGVSQIVVAVNKLDNVNWDKRRFEEIADKVSHFLVQECGFKKTNVSFIPTSGFTGENLLKRNAPELIQWYSGPSLVEQIDKFKTPERPITKPLRMSITDHFKGGTNAGASVSVTVAGRIDQGGVQTGETILIVPGNYPALVRTIALNNEPHPWAAAGDQVLLGLQGLDITQVSAGSVACDLEKPVKPVKKFRARVVTFDVEIPLIVGATLTLHTSSYTTPAHVSALISLHHRTTNELLKKNPRAVPKHSVAVVDVVAERGVCVDVVGEWREGGRVTFRRGGKSVAGGVVVECLEFE